MNKTMNKSPRTIYTVSGTDCTIQAIAQGFRFGKVGVRSTESKDGTPVRSFCSYLRVKQLEEFVNAFNNPMPKGMVLLDAADTVSAQVCAEKGFRKDGKALCKKFTAVLTPDNRILFTSALQAGNETDNGKITPDKNSSCRTIEVFLQRSEALGLVIAMEQAYAHYISNAKNKQQKVSEPALDVEPA